MDFSLPAGLSSELERFKEFIKVHVRSELSAWSKEKEIPPQFFEALGDGGWYGLQVKDNDVTRGSDKLVTRNGCYRSVDLSPDGKKFAAVSQRQAKTYLLEVPVNKAGEKEHETVLASSPLEVDIAAPRYSPEGNRIVYVEADRDLFSLKLYDLSKNKAITS